VEDPEDEERAQRTLKQRGGGHEWRQFVRVVGSEGVGVADGGHRGRRWRTSEVTGGG
jgi:hypothetical protein